MISVRVDADTKVAVQEVLETIGLKLGTVINAYLRQIALTRKVEFYAPEMMTPHLEKLIASIEKEIKTGQVSPKFDNTDDFLNSLKS
jgi:addiction module RelB/DinJ family antitoxin